MTRTSLSCVLFLGLISAVTALAQPKYSIKYLGTLGGQSADARGINDAGEVTGGSDIAGNTAVHAFLYDGTMHDLGTLGGNGSVGFGINHGGKITGIADIPGSTHSHAFLYDGTMHDLGTLEGGSSVGLGINDIGQVVGYSYALGTTAFHAFLYDGTTMHDLGLGEAAGINNAGHATGYFVPGSVARAFLYDGTIHDLGTLGGSGSVGQAINTLGQITGQAQTLGNAANHAFLYDGAAMHDLGTLGGPSSIGLAINNAGHVVGYSDTPGSQHAFLYDGTAMYDLDNLVAGSPVTFHFAFGINNLDQIVADDYLGRAYLLTPVTRPVIRNASASPDTLWPPNQNFTEVTISYTVTSSSDVACRLSVTSNEPGNTEWTVTDAHHVSLLAKRDGNGTGRIYTVAINCTNVAGTTAANTTIVVPHDQRQ